MKSGRGGVTDAGRDLFGRTPAQRRLAWLIALLTVAAGVPALLAPSAGAADAVPISGSGSTWSANALDQWRRNVANLLGITVNFSATGSTNGRNDFRTGVVDFAVSEIPYGLTDGGVLDPVPARAFGYLPIVAGGTAFMYNLKINGSRVTNLRLSGETLARIFTQQIATWSDPAIQADNPGLVLPDRAIVPVVRSDGSGPTTQFTAFLASQYPAIWDAYCHRVGRNVTPCGSTSFYPLNGHMVAKAGSQGVAGFVAQDSSEGAITFVEYAYARNAGFPVAKMLNAAHYYVTPTASNVAVALLNTTLHPDLTADLSQVYTDPDPRAYPLSNYNYMIIPKSTDQSSNFNVEKGRTLSEFADYFLCEGQQQADALGYSPLPINLVQAGVDQINQIPGSTHKLDRNNLSGCHNPTISPTGGNLLAENAPQPQPCDLKGPTQCTTPGPPPSPPPGPPPTSLPPPPPPTSPPPPPPPPAESPVTVSGTGAFANLKVTISQTRYLRNQAVSVSWTGGAPTAPFSGSFGVNYLQIMQCWGDDPAGPDRTQCQYGGLSTQTSPSAGTLVRSRQVSTNGTLVDPRETLTSPPGGAPAFVPFWPAGRVEPVGAADSDRNDFFDAQSTNEIPLARTHADGTGQESFEVETAREAAGLDCGSPVTGGGGTTGRRCWLVIVPRSDQEVDGTLRSGSGRLDSSPLSRSNWDHRIAIPLEFPPLGQPCPIGSPERPVMGNEQVVDAVSAWRPALCAGGGTLFSYTQLPDDLARDRVLNGGLAVVNSPVPADQEPEGHPLVYAPVGLSGLSIAFNIDHQPAANNASAPNQQLDGQRFTSMKLTPRLVAKLLTQSYQDAVPVTAAQTSYLRNNPFGLLLDPEFLSLNPEYKGFADQNEPVPDALVQLNGADVTSELWSWVKADPDGRAFLDGQPDPYGMVVNPNNKGLNLPTSVFPRNDQSCESVTDPGPPPIPYTQCVVDSHPYAVDMHDAGRAASRGNSLARNTIIQNGQPVPIPSQRQPNGHRALLAVVDTATAARYGLPTAQLLNAAGNFVAPTVESLVAGAAAMKPSPVPGVLAADPGTTDPAAYPLTALSYAVTSPSRLDAAAGRDYATLLRYAAVAGQQPGPLPPGMVPLPEALRAQTIAAATTIETQHGPAPATTTTALSVTPPGPANPGSTETLTATITPPSAAGSVRFTDGTTPLGSQVAVSHGTATLTTTLTPGTHTLGAVFTPADTAAVAGSISPTTSYTVSAPTAAAATTTTLTGFPNPALPVILRATVTPPTAAGTIQFRDGTTALGAPVPVIGGHAKLRTPALTPGTHSLTAAFTPTDPAAFGLSSSQPLSVRVTGQSQQIAILLRNFLQALFGALRAFG